jgi:hypothetical protein
MQLMIPSLTVTVSRCTSAILCRVALLHLQLPQRLIGSSYVSFKHIYYFSSNALFAVFNTSLLLILLIL